ncbi:hypothetical protein EOL70_05875 [Leucothrix sargassi]|nr:hypothetical protein EOL70_05875 [Leucothrix sargassi]
MSACRADTFCSFLSQYITITSPLQYTLICIVLGVTIVYSVFQFGRAFGRADLDAAQKDAFVEGIMYHINVLAYDDAKTPHKHDAAGDDPLVEAQNRLAKKLKPKLPK